MYGNVKKKTSSVDKTENDGNDQDDRIEEEEFENLMEEVLEVFNDADAEFWEKYISHR